MHVELVCPAAEDSAHLRSLGVGILAALTPAEVRLSLKDDIVRRLDPDRDLDFGADLAALSVSTKTARRAYALAAAYRRRGVRVVMGGIHPTAVPEEALQHCDAVVVGEAEGLWERVLVDARSGQLQREYRHHTWPDFRRSTWARRDIFPAGPYPPLHTVQASRGCPFSCEFCSVTPFYGQRLRVRDVSDVVGEIEALDRRWVIFADDNILGQPRAARELFHALRGARVTWFGQASLQGMHDLENVRLMGASGCRGLFVGFDSINRESLLGCGKRQNNPRRYLETVERLHDAGIGVFASFVFGLDEDRDDVFERTVEFAQRARVFMAMFSILTPYPGTPLHRRLKQENRLFSERWWLDPDQHDFPVFRPRHLTVERLYEGWQGAWKDFYGGVSILKRMTRAAFSSWVSLASFLPLNLLQRRLVHEKVLGGDRFFLRDR